MAKKSRDPRFELPPLELECMKALWSLGEGTVQEIRERLFPKRPLAYTTVMTVMDRLARKGAVEREKNGRAHVYRATVTEELVRERAVARLVENFFRSRDGLQQYLQIVGASATRFPGAGQGGHRPKKTAGARPAENIDTTLL